jgi:lipoyl(octanoyl) transferase
VTWRLLVTEPADGATNMALDEALWRGRLAGTAPPTLRFFAWVPPTVSIGYGQRIDHRLNLDACARLGVGFVRRPTGGSGIYHDGPERELTYSVVAGVDDFDAARDLLESYRWIAQGLVAGLQRLGVPAEMVSIAPAGGAQPAFCFARTGSYEIEVGGRKLVGSAQRRHTAGFLQHGSVLMDADPDRLRLLFPGEGDPLAGMTTIRNATGRRPSFTDVATALAEGFASVHALDLRPGGLTVDEQHRLEQLVRDRYSTCQWNEHRRRRALDLSRVS